MTRSVAGWQETRRDIVDKPGSPQTMTREAIGQKSDDFPFPGGGRYSAARVDGWKPPWSRVEE